MSEQGYVMSPLRRAFCEMMSTIPGPDAAMYARWASSGDLEDAAELADYVRATIRAVERFGDENGEARHVPMLQALLAELEGR